MTSTASIITVSYQDLQQFDPEKPNQKLVDIIGQAFGPDKLGIMAVSGVPDFEAKRSKLLPLAAKLPHLPDLDDCVSPETHYSIGWSHGKEELEPGKPDLAKGSFYGNPRTDDTSSKVDPELAKKHPDLYCDNIWPKSLPELREAFMDLGETVVQTGVLVARVCDVYCKQKGVTTEFAKILSESMNTKGRLLHYFPMKSEPGDMWCGWHNDHGSLTGLVPGMYLDLEENATSCPDETAGLYIQDRSGNVVKAALPMNALGFQIGETSQIQSGGCLQATPHAVRPAGTGDVSRETFAVFLEPEFSQPLNIPPGKTVEDCQAPDVKLPSSVLPLKDRWKSGMTFGDFHLATVTAFTK